jgi:hypothetical protein
VDEKNFIALSPGGEIETTFSAIVFESNQRINGFDDNLQIIKK